MRRKNNIQRRFYAIGDILFTLLKRRGMAYKIEENKLLKLWPKAIGTKICQQTKADAFKNGTLFVKTTSSVWVQQLYFMKEEICGKLNEIAGKNIVKDIRFSIGHTIDKNNDVESAQAKSLLKERDKRMIADCTASLADRELASIFQRVMKGEISRRRRIETQQVLGK